MTIERMAELTNDKSQRRVKGESKEKSRVVKLNKDDANINQLIKRR